MGLRLRFNLVMVVVFLAGWIAAGGVSRRLLQDNAREEVVREGRLLLEAATAIRDYVIDHVQPHLVPPAGAIFRPQSVPAFAATETLNNLRRHHPHYRYKEATLNPTNPRNRAADWEADLVQRFRQSPDLREVIAERPTPAGRSLFIARPIQVAHAACLHCHGLPATAPPSMLAIYGPANGFGWKQGEIVGAQIVNVPMTVPLAQSDRLFATFMVSLAAVFLMVFVVLNVMLGWLILRPVRRMAQAADRLSTGDFTEPEFADHGRHEIAVLGKSFNRLRRSLKKAMEMIQVPCRR